MSDGLAERAKLYESAEAGRRLIPLLPALARLYGRIRVVHARPNWKRVRLFVRAENRLGVLFRDEAPRGNR